MSVRAASVVSVLGLDGTREAQFVAFREVHAPYHDIGNLFLEECEGLIIPGCHARKFTA
jgi:hypothetical protein